jgi:class 3 adenylate cyclase
MTTTRRLAAILAADVAGYSRLMGTDEEGTLGRLKALRRELIDPKLDDAQTLNLELIAAVGRLLSSSERAVPVAAASNDRNRPAS